MMAKFPTIETFLRKWSLTIFAATEKGGKMMAEYSEREAVFAEIENLYKDAEKIKTSFAKIIVDGTVEKPYYSILWLDKENKEYNVGYSSYCLDYVFKWLEVVFELVAADEPPTIDPESLRPQGEWIVQDIGRTKFSCSHCKARNYEGHEKYCPNCGAKMKGGTE